MADFFTQAGNFLGDGAESVDPRTGLYSVSLPLGTLHGNKLRGPSLALNLGYSALAEDDFGFGIGWNFEWTTYDSDTGRLQSATGDSLIARSLPDGQMKIEQLHLTSIGIDNLGGKAYKVRHSSGLVEILKGDNQIHSSLKVPEAMYSKTGEKLSLGWTDIYADGWWLDNISDDDGVLLQVDYPTTFAYTHLTFWPGTAEECEVRLDFFERRLTQVTHGKDIDHNPDAAMVWQMFYTTYTNAQGQDVPLLNKVIFPTGLVEEVVYGGLQKLPDGALTATVPCVTTHTQSPGSGQPDVVVEYSFSENNYLGWGADFGSSGWQADTDNLYNAKFEDYVYTSRATMKCAGSPDTVRDRTYNMYHLVIRDTLTCGQSVIDKQTTFGVLKNVEFNDQPAYFQQPLLCETTYSRPASVPGEPSERTEVESWSYNDAGLCVQQTATDGVVQTWEYYPPEGSGDACPPDPNQLCWRRKSHTITYPWVSDPMPWLAHDPAYRANELAQQSHTFDTPVRCTLTSYGSLARGGDPSDFTNPIASVVVAKSEIRSIDGRPFHTVDYEYVEEPGPAIGLIQTLREGFIPAGGSPLVRTMNYEYSSDEDTVTTELLTTTFDNLTFRTSNIQGIRAGQPLATMDAVNVTTKHSFDVFGRVLRSEVAPDTQYSYGTEHTYGGWSASKAGRSGTSHAMDNGAHCSARACYDGFGHVVAHQGSSDGEWIDHETFVYDSLGRVIEKHERDVLDPESGSGLNIDIHTTVTYDDWGRPASLQTNLGDSRTMTYNPITLQTTMVQAPDNDAKTIVQHNSWNVDISTSRVYSSGAVETSYKVYDGAKRLRRQVDEMNVVTEYHYDDWDRICRIETGNDTVIEKSYALHTSEALITEIKVNGVVLGTQTFDGMKRLKSSTSGGRQHTYFYLGTMPTPFLVYAPDGTFAQNEYIPEQNCVLRSTTVTGAQGEFKQQFEYDVAFGNLVSAEQTKGDGVSLSVQLDGVGRQTVEQVAHSAHLSRSTTDGYSLFGRATTHQDAGGLVRSVTYDEMGRVRTTDDGTSTITANYDSYSRLAGWTLSDAHGAPTHEVVLEYDEFRREIRRTIYDAAQTWALDMRRTLRPDGLISERITTLQDAAGKRELRDESYSYDLHRRLQTYTCEGQSPPQDGTGLGILSQTFDHDCFNNIIRCVTTYADQSVNEAVYSFKNPDDPCQLTNVSNSHPSLPASRELKYDPCGRMTQDADGRILSYDIQGRLVAVTAASASMSHRYDPLGTRRSQEKSGTSANQELYYEGYYPDITITTQGATTSVRRWLRLGEDVVTDRVDDAAPAFIGTDDKLSVVASALAGAVSPDTITYTPYGQRSSASAIPTPLGFNGQLLDDVGDCYHLGNGYRPYSATLMRFAAPDSLSPFGAGGINPYCYCAGDPINLSDPNGHLAWWAWTAIGVGIAISLATGVGAALAIGTGFGTLTLFSGGVLAATAVGGLGGGTTGIVATGFQIAAATATTHPLDGQRDYSNSAQRTASVLWKISLGFGVLDLVGIGGWLIGGTRLGTRVLQIASRQKEFQASQLPKSVDLGRAYSGSPEQELSPGVAPERASPMHTPRGLRDSDRSSDEHGFPRPQTTRAPGSELRRLPEYDVPHEELVTRGPRMSQMARRTRAVSAIRARDPNPPPTARSPGSAADPNDGTFAAPDPFHIYHHF